MVETVSLLAVAKEKRLDGSLEEVKVDQAQTSRTLTGIPIRSKVKKEVVLILLSVMKVNQVRKIHLLLL